MSLFKIKIKIFFVLVILGLLCFRFIPSVHADGENWLTGYGYRKAITITGSSSGALTNYQLKFLLNKGAGSDSGNTIYLGTNVLDSFNDIRFATSDGNTALDYWVQSVSGIVATVWVEVDSVPANPSTKTIYLYYGKAGASSASNGDNTFAFYDDFNDDSIDTNKWTVSTDNAVLASYSESGGYARLTGTASGSWHSASWEAKNTFGPGYALTASQYYSDFVFPSNITAQMGFTSADWNDRLAMNIQSLNWASPSNSYKIESAKSGTASYSNISSPHNAWRTYDFIWTPTVNKIIINGVTEATISDTSYISTDTALNPKIILQPGAGNGYVYTDWFMVRKYVNNEPTVSAGAEATPDSTPPTIQTYSPANNATSVSSTANLVLAFNENITAVTGKNITIKKVSDNSEIETVAADDTGKVTIVNNTASINPATVLDDVTQYYVSVEAGAFKDLFNNSFAGITDSTTWRFTTSDSAAPTVVALSPVSGSFGVQLSGNLAIEFNENVNVGSGSVSIFNKFTDVLVEAVDVTSGQVTGGGTSIISINPTTNLVYATDYYIKIDPTAFTDSSSNSYSGISDKTSWVLQTVLAPASSVESSVSSGSQKKLPDPVHTIDVNEKEVKSVDRKILSKIEVEQDAPFVLHVKAPDPDQVKNVVVTINKKTYKLALAKDKKGNPEFFIKLALSKPGNYPYSIISDYGSTVRRAKGEVIIKKKAVAVILPSPKPIYSKQNIVKEKPFLIKQKPTANNVVEKSKIEKKTEVAPTVPTMITTVPESSLEIPTEKIPNETWIDLTFNLFKTTGSKTSSMISNTSRSFVGLFVGTGEKIAKLFEKNPAHVYRKVTVKLTSEEGTPLIGATVTISSEPQTAVSDSDGKVQFENIEAGKHQLKVDYQGYSTKQALSITEPVTEVTINITAVFKK